MIKLVLFDFDGVFTDGKVYFDTNGNISKCYNVNDGFGINLLKKNNIEIGIISGYKLNNSQKAIIDHLKIKYFSFDNNKLTIAKNWCKNLDINLTEEAAFIGDDINDIELMQNIKISGCPQDANKDCLDIVKFISKKNGGHGCVRDFCEYIIEFNISK